MIQIQVIEALNKRIVEDQSLHSEFGELSLLFEGAFFISSWLVVFS